MRTQIGLHMSMLLQLNCLYVTAADVDMQFVVYLNTNGQQQSLNYSVYNDLRTDTTGQLFHWPCMC